MDHDKYIRTIQELEAVGSNGGRKKSREKPKR